jgi:hypothetical protein
MFAHNKDLRVTSPAWAIQYFTYKVLAPISILMGYQSFYHLLGK